MGKQIFEGRTMLLPAAMGKLEVGNEEFLGHQGQLEMRSHLPPPSMKEPSVMHAAPSSNTCQAGSLGSDILGGSAWKAGAGGRGGCGGREAQIRLL